MNTHTIKATVRTKAGDEFAPLSAQLRKEIGLSERQMMGLREEAIRRREDAHRRNLARLDASDRQAEIQRLARSFPKAPAAFPPWWLVLLPAAGLTLVLALAGMWL